MISFRPVTSRVAARMLRATVECSAERTVELSQPVECSVDLPIMLPDEAERIRAHIATSTPVLNLERLTSTVLRLGPTRLHLLRDVLISNGSIMSRKFFQRMRPDARRFWVRGAAEEIKEAILCNTHFTEHYFAHWLQEGVGLEQLAHDVGIDPIVLDRKLWLHELSYRQLLQLHPRSVSIARVDRLWVPEEPFFTAGFAERYHRLRHRLRRAVLDGAAPDARVFISRGKTGRGRVLANEEEVRTALAAHGFVTLDPERESAADIARLLARTRLVVAPEGSALAHAAIALPSGAGLLTIIGAQHFNMPYKAVSDVLGFTFGFTIADALDQDNFTQPIDRLLGTIDLVDEAAARRTG